jgi:glucokinase
LTAKDVADAFQHRDALAERIIQSTGSRLGEALAILVDLFNPERIVIGGLAMRLGQSLLEPARRVMEREALPASAKICQIVPAALGETIGDVAAICVAMGFTLSASQVASNSSESPILLSRRTKVSLR